MKFFTHRLSHNTKSVECSLGLIGTVGIPNKYGGFESFVESMAPALVECGVTCIVTCFAGAYVDRQRWFDGVRRVFIPVPANGGWSILHDFLAFFAVVGRCTHVLVLGVSGGGLFPLFKLVCKINNVKLLVNIDGVEWRREKYGVTSRLLLRSFDW